MHVDLIDAFADNYIFSIVEDGACMIVDPGIAPKVVEYLSATKFRLERILVTHHHDDHIGGVAELQRETGAELFGPSSMAKYGLNCDRVLADGQTFSFHALDFNVLAVPGHTLDHLAYFETGNHTLLCGDTLFSLGCGRLFEGTFAQMFASLAKIKALPDDTAVYCAHEYTLNNLKFSLEFLSEAEPAKRDEYVRLLAQVSARREQNLPTIPSSLGFESISIYF